MHFGRRRAGGDGSHCDVEHCTVLPHLPAVEEIGVVIKPLLPERSAPPRLAPSGAVLRAARRRGERRGQC